MIVKRFSEICKIKSFKRIFESEYADNGIPFIRGQEISDGSIASKRCDFSCYITNERYEELKKEYGVPHMGDILITAVGTIGNLYIIEEEKNFYVKDGNVLWLADIEKEINPKYLYYYMQSDLFKKRLGNQLIGAVQKALTIDKLSGINIDIPEKSQQNSIVQILDFINAKITKNNAINDNLCA